jgi:hypothetical protein
MKQLGSCAERGGDSLHLSKLGPGRPELAMCSKLKHPFCRGYAGPIAAALPLFRSARRLSLRGAVQTISQKKERTRGEYKVRARKVTLFRAKNRLDLFLLPEHRGAHLIQGSLVLLC